MSKRKRTYFQIPDKVSVAAVRRWLKRSIKCEKTGSYHCRHTFLDSFDSRLYRAGIILELEAAGDRLVIQRHSLTDNSVGQALTVVCPPRFSGDFPPGGLRRELRALLNVRALLPVAEANSHVEQFSVAGEDGDELLRIIIDTSEYSNGIDDKPQPILYVESGQERLHDRISKRIAKQFSESPQSLPLMVTAMKASGYRPAEYTATFTVELTAQMRADVALRAILLRLFDIVQANEEGVIANIDPEFLHDYRVAVRRTRSIVARVRGVIPERWRLQLLDGLRWLGEITGPSRDIDVYLLNFSEFKKLLPPSMREHIEPLQDYLQRHQKMAHERLTAEFSSVRYRQVIDNWRQLLATMDFRKRPAEFASRPIMDVAGRSIWKCYRKVIRQGGAINCDSPPDVLHGLRKSCKKLRYLLEAFAGLYPGKEMKWVIKQLKSLQDLLGEYQDLRVHAEKLRYFGREMHKEMVVDSNTDEAIEQLGEGFDEKQEELKKEVMAYFQEFSSVPSYQRFKGLFKQNR